MQKVKINGHTQSLELSYYEALEPTERALVIVHGASEGALRYAQMATLFTTKFNVIVYNHQGHENGIPVNFEFDEIVGDTQKVILYAQNQYSDVTIFAHSMGTCVLKMCSTYIRKNTKIILSGAVVTSKLDNFKLLLLSLLLKFYDEDKVSEKLNYLLFTEKNDKNGLENHKWLSSREAVYTYYNQSNLYGQPFTNRSLKALVKLLRQTNKSKVLKKLAKYNIMLVSGGTDVFTNNGDGYQQIIKHTPKGKIHIYPNSYHEVHNDIDAYQLFDDIFKFCGVETNEKN